MERSQLDISDPYKVYRIVPEGAKKGGASWLGPPDPLTPPCHCEGPFLGLLLSIACLPQPPIQAQQAIYPRSLGHKLKFSWF